MNNEELRKVADTVERAMLMAYKYNRLIAMMADLSPETVKAIFKEAAAANHFVALADLPPAIVAKAK